MNITGSWSGTLDRAGIPSGSCSGAFYAGSNVGNYSGNYGWENKFINALYFDASRSWSGETSGASAVNHTHTFTTDSQSESTTSQAEGSTESTGSDTAFLLFQVTSVSIT